MAATCDNCGASFTGRGRFCRIAGNNCRQKWHRDNTAPGLVTGFRQLKSGKWRVSVDYPDLPPVKMGDRVLVEKADIPRPCPSTGEQQETMPKDTA